MAAANILSAPVCTAETSEYIGMIDVVDIVGGLIRMSYPEFFTCNGQWLEEHPRLGIAELTAIGTEYGNKRIESLLHGGELWFQGDSDTSLLKIIEDGFRVKVPPRIHSPKHSLRVHHRVAVFDILPGEQTPDGPIPEWRITDVVSQFDVMTFLASRVEELKKTDPLMQRSLSSLGLVKNPVLTVSASMPVIVAFAYMQTENVSGVGIVAGADCDEESTSNQKDQLIGNLSVSDLRGVLPEQFGRLALPLGTYLLEHHGVLQWDDILVGQVPSAVKEEKWADILPQVTKNNLLKCSPESILADIVVLMVEQGKHRVYVCDEDGSPVGVITPTDILRLLVS